VANGAVSELDRVADGWQRSLDAAQGALSAAGRTLPPRELGQRLAALQAERQRTAELLDSSARTENVAGLWLSPVPVTPRMLGLDASVRGCVFDLDGVLTDSGRAHAAAWAEVLDGVLLQLTELTGWHFIPFDRDADYRAYLDGRTRIDGIHAFLDSRGIHLDHRAALELAHAKRDALARVLARRGVTALAGARRYLEAAGHAGLPRAVLSWSRSTHEMIELAGIAGLVDVTVDAADLPSRPAPDALLAACYLLGVEPDATISFTHAADGVAAARSAGVAVVRVGEDVPSLDRLLDARRAGR
jgi:beta-phosphoglucomutase-like phosphatase (HAD superfamily)